MSGSQQLLEIDVAAHLSSEANSALVKGSYYSMILGLVCSTLISLFLVLGSVKLKGEKDEVTIFGLEE